MRSTIGLWRKVRAGASETADPEQVRQRIAEGGLTARSARQLGEALQRSGRLLQALEVLQLANRLQRDPELDRELVRLRHAAFAELDRHSMPSTEWPPFAPEDRPGQAEDAPVVQAHELTPAVLRNGIRRHGCVLARGLVPAWRVDRLVEAIDRAFAGHDKWLAGGSWSGGGEPTPPDFEPFANLQAASQTREFARTGLGVLAVDSPAGLYEFLETVREVGIGPLISAYLGGERIALSAEKCTLRRVDSTPTGAQWHQDGAFMGQGIRTVNAWLSLSHCGVDAPGLDIIPRRVDHVLPTGGDDSIFDWALSEKTIARAVPGVSVWRPRFEPGDVLFMDELLVHRTAAEAHMPNLRYAIESWFFAASVYPDGVQTPILV